MKHNKLYSFILKLYKLIYSFKYTDMWKYYIYSSMWMFTIFCLSVFEHMPFELVSRSRCSRTVDSLMEICAATSQETEWPSTPTGRRERLLNSVLPLAESEMLEMSVRLFRSVSHSLWELDVSVESLGGSWRGCRDKRSVGASAMSVEPPSTVVCWSFCQGNTDYKLVQTTL